MARDFAKFAPRGAPHLDSGFVERDLRTIKAACAAAETYADRRIAHRDVRARGMQITSGEADRALDTIGSLVEKYFLLLFCSGLDIHPIPQAPVYHIFTVPWMPSSKVPSGGV